MKLLFAFAFVFIFRSASFAQISSVTPQPSADQCHEATASLKKHQQSLLDPSVLPCEDFHAYACGNWHAPASLRRLNAHDTISQLRADNKLQLMTYFENMQPPISGKLSDAEVRTTHFYHSCLDYLVNGSERNSSLNLFNDLLHKFSQWPILDEDYNEQTANATFNWQHVSAQLRRYGVESFWQLHIRPNWQAAEQTIFYMVPPAFDMLKPSKMAQTYDEDSVFLYERYIKYLLLDLGVRIRPALKTATEIVDFERHLFELLAPSPNSMVLHEPQTLASLDAALPELHLVEYFSILLAEFELPESRLLELMIAADKSYLSRLGKFLGRSKAEIIGKWLLVQFLAHYEFRMHDDSSLLEQKKQCLQQMNTLLPNELSEVFFKLQHGSDGGREMHSKLGEIFGALKVRFEHLLNTTHIFDKDALSKVLGLEKLRAMRLLLPPPSQSVQSTIVGWPEVVSDNYTLNLINLSRWHARLQLQQVLQAASSSGEAGSFASNYGPLQVNAYYRLKKNAIELPIGVLRQPFYDRCLSAAALHGGLGYMLGHELLHGFDYDGLHYDKVGNFAAGNWSAHSMIQFGLKASCYLTGRYDESYTTINENIADSEGLRLALEAFADTNKAAGRHSNEWREQLQLFFTTFAQVWCGSGGSSSASKASEHAGHSERVNNVVGNFEEFAEAFQCRPTAKMNPGQKCRIW